MPDEVRSPEEEPALGSAGLHREIDLNQVFRPPAPTPKQKRLGLLGLLSVLRTNPLEAFSDEFFVQPSVRSGLPFMPAVVLNDPRAIRHVLVDNAANYRKDDLLLRILSPGLGNGLLTVEGERWRRQRRAVAPVLARRTILASAPAMLEGIGALSARWRGRAGEIVDVAQEMAGLTLDVLRRTIFSGGLQCDSQEFRAAMRAYFDSIGRIDPFDALGLPEFLPRPTRLSEGRALRYFRSAVDRIIAERTKAMAAGGAPRDLLTLLLEAGNTDGDGFLSDEEVRANLLTFIAAGHETTANALTWSLYLLSQSPEWEARVVAEAACADCVNGDDPCAHLPETRALIEEALRLYPPIAAISRVAIGDDEAGGETISRGTMVIVAPYVVHRHRLLWDEPERFDPSRFLGPAREGIDRYAYLPFGAGPRICIGASFALQEATLALSAIVRDFRLPLAAGFDVEPLLRITLRPRQGLPMVVELRYG